ncbi:MAG: YitT family protein [Desulfotomaculum sp.]|nr:YitT family protein [Desulfotomaculum sp.]
MLRIFIRYVGVFAGVVITALGLNLFLVPHKIAAGGVSGIAIILHHLINTPVGLVMLALNVPLFIWGIIRLGWSFAFYSLFGTIMLTVAIDGSAPFLPVLTKDLLLASIFGGVVTGLGLGLVFRCQGSTGGTTILAAILRSYTGMNIGQLLFVVDAIIVVAAGIAFQSWELAMYAMITIFISSWVIDIVQEGFAYDKAFMIITAQPKVVATAILKDMNRGATAWQAQGMFTGSEKHVLLSVVHQGEVTKLKEIIYQADPAAFVILADVREVLGEGFKPIK